MYEDVITVLKERRSIRAYKPDDVPEDVLEKILDAGTWAPTGQGSQSPLIVAVKNEQMRKTLSAMNAEVLGVDIDPYFEPPVILLVFGRTEHRTCVQDACCVLVYMMLAAKSLGLDTCWINREKQMFESERGQELMAAWDIPEGYEGVGALSLGYAAQDASAPPERKADYYRIV
ncbi:MAG: nitroreductase family protein [Clostridiales Family XIII bacterium]|jgi:nitroreductase|nr:nitroreductase family protein [Clostridiales Family XIII bacterium]